MANEKMQLGEGFSATVKKAGTPIAGPLPPPEPALRHRVIGWGVLASIIGALIWWFTGPGHHQPEPAQMQERPGLIETFKPNKIGGVLYLDIIRSALNKPLVEWATPFTPIYENTHFGPIPNTIVNEGENVLEDCFEGNAGSACTQVALFKFHGLGTSSQAIAETDGGCITELTTQYTGDVRATGSQTNNGANIYRTVGTNTIDSGGPVTIREFCLMDVNTGAGNTWTRILTGDVVLATNDALSTTYDLTIE